MSNGGNTAGNTGFGTLLDEPLHWFLFEPEMSDELVAQALASLKLEARSIQRKEEQNSVVWVLADYPLHDEIRHVLSRWAFWNGPPVD